MRRGPAGALLAIALLATLVGACVPVGIAEDWRSALVKIYNRTLTVVSFDGGWVPICSTGSEGGLPPWPSPITSPPLGAVPITFDLGVPADYKGIVSVIVSEVGIQVIRGEPVESELPKCSGAPPS
jgi:hypothetical protein